MKKGRIFATIVYFIFTFGIGIGLALVLPQYFVAFSIPAEYAADLLPSGEYVRAMMVVGDCFNNTPVYEKKLSDDSGIVLFETVMQYDGTSSDDTQTDEAASQLINGMLYKTYMGYLYGVQDSYKVYSQNNSTKLIVTTQNGNTVPVEILDYDTNNDGRKDGLSTVEQYGFVVLDIPSDVGSVAKLQFLDADGNQFWVSDDLTSLNLNFDSEFYRLFDRIDEYNALARQLSQAEDEATYNSLREQLTGVFKSMTDKVVANEGYTLVGNGDIYQEVAEEMQSRADKKAIPIVVVYFVAIYIIADFLLGSHLIIKFFNWFLFSVCKIPRKQKTPKKEEVFGHDYFSMVTLKLDTSAVPEFSGSVEIKYTNSDSEAKWTLLKAENYTATQRIKAGVYVNPHIDINRSYAPVDLPDNLNVEGYRVDRLVRIVKRDVPVEATQEAEPAETPAQPDIGQQTPPDTKQEN